MEICGIVTEYNPFHNGHQRHIAESIQTANADCVIAVMSGNFVQRGEPAIIDKFARTKMALLNGVDMVLELPVYYATAGAEHFARAAVSVLENCGIVGSICFGSESGDITALKAVAHKLLNEDGEFKSTLKQALSKGVSYPKARQAALERCGGLTELALNEPNNILAIEYLKAIELLSSPIVPYTIKRQGAHYHSENISSENIASATAIRKTILNAPTDALCGVMPQNCLDILRNEINSGNITRSIDEFSDIFHYIVATTDSDILKNIADVDEGLENRIIACAQSRYLISDIASAVKTKRYVLTKIKRALLHIILSITKEDFNYFNADGYSQYIRVLGFRKQSEHLLTLLHEKAKLPVITNLKYADRLLCESAKRMLQKEIEATQIYQAAMKKNNAEPTPELSGQLVIV